MKNTLIIMFITLVTMLYAREIPSKDLKVTVEENVQFGSVEAKIVRFGGFTTPECKLAISVDGTYFFFKKMKSTCKKITNSKGVKIVCNANKSVCKTRNELINIIQNNKPSQVDQIDDTLSSWCNASHLNITEHTICANDILRKLDKKLANVYGAVKADRKDKSQRVWLKQRNRCKSDVTCIRQAYEERIEQLNSQKENDWWSIFKLNRKTIAKKYPELPLETINKMAESDTLKECKNYDDRDKIKQLIKTQLMAEVFDFAKNRYYDYKRKMSKDTMDKLYFYEMVLGLRLSGEEMELISKYNIGKLFTDSMSSLDDCAYNNACYSLATDLEILYLPEKVKKISKEELRIFDQMIIKFLKRDCNNILKKYSDCSNPEKNGCYGSSCSLLASIYGDQHKFVKGLKNIDEALKISHNMCYDKNNAESCGVLGSILIDKGTKYYQKAKHAFQKGCKLTNNREKDSGNICLWCCDNYKDLINKGW